MAEKSEVYVVDSDRKFEEERHFEMRFDDITTLAHVPCQNCGYFPAVVQLLGRNGAEGGDLAISARTGFLKKLLHSFWKEGFC